VKKKLALFLPGLLLAAGLISVSAPPAHAQEGEAVVVDEVIAQVNDAVITLSMLKRGMKDAIDTMVSQGKSREEATALMETKKAELINELINEQLLLAKGKELDLAPGVEAEVNSRLLAAGKEQGITKLEDLCAAMKQSGLDCDEVRNALRTEVMKMAVMNRAVDAKLFYDTTDAELQAYFNAHKDKFKKPESVDISEIFLELAGKSEADVKAKAAQLVAQLRGGADFVTLAKANSERQRDGVRTAVETGGYVGLLEVPTLKPEFAAAIKDVKAGGVTDPIVMAEGIQILRVNSRNAGSDTPQFNENAVREAITMEKAPEARKAYMVEIRKDAYIKIAEGYRAMVGPVTGEATTPSAVTTAENKEKKSDKKDKKQ
jgi:parvulin-like peptidyl-prolyl isomerase